MYVRDIDIPFYDKIKRLRLVKPDPKYAPITIQWISKNEVTKYLGADFSKMTVDDEVQHLTGMISDDDCYSWMIELDGEVVGNIEINKIKKLGQKYGVKIGRSEPKRGLVDASQQLYVKKVESEEQRLGRLEQTPRYLKNPHIIDAGFCLPLDYRILRRLIT